MKKIFPPFAVFAVLTFYLFCFIYFGLYETTDSYFFIAFSEFIKTGRYFVPHPYYWTVPSTITPPFYSLFLYLAQLLPNPHLLIHLAQIVAFLIALFFIYKVLIVKLPKQLSLLITALFAVLPVNVIQTSAIMTETLAIGFTSFYIYLAGLILIKKQRQYLPLLIIISSISILLRYNFFIFYIMSAGLIFLDRKGKRINRSQIAAVITGVIIIISWIGINHSLNGSWGLSSQQGKNIYNRVLGYDKLSPPHNNRDWQKLQLLVPGKNFLDFVWNIEPYILPNFNGNVTYESLLFGKIALAAIYNHPLEYSWNTLKNLFVLHGNGYVYPELIFSYYQNCRQIGLIDLCRSANGPVAAAAWDRIVTIGNFMSRSLPALVNGFFLLPSLIYALLQKKIFLRFIAVLYLLSALTTVLVELPAHRYLYPFYSLQLILIFYSISPLIGKSLKKQN